MQMSPNRRVNFDCRIQDCERPAWVRQLCRRHYARWWKYGDPLAGVGYTNAPLQERIMFYLPKRRPPDRCWEWKGYRDPNGYGRLNVAGVPLLAHRLVWEEMMGPCPEGLEPDHTCENPPCVNPAHLEWVTHAENLRRAREGRDDV